MTMRKRLYLGGVIALLGLAGAKAEAAGRFIDVCGGGGAGGTPAGGVPFPGQNSPLFTCVFAGGGQATGGADQTDAGLGFFHDGITVVYDTSAGAQNAANGDTLTAVSNPTWPAGTIAVPSFLALLGSVQIPDPTASITFTLTGFLGNAANALTIPAFTLTQANCRHCTLDIVRTGNLLPLTPATEILTISSVGRVVYRTDSPIFEGAVPEPATWALMLAGFGGLGAVMRSRRRTIVEAA